MVTTCLIFFKVLKRRRDTLTHESNQRSNIAKEINHMAIVRDVRRIKTRN